MEIFIEKGMTDRQKIVLKGEGDQMVSLSLSSAQSLGSRDQSKLIFVPAKVSSRRRNLRPQGAAPSGLPTLRQRSPSESTTHAL